MTLSWKTFNAKLEVMKITKKYVDMGAEEQIVNLILLMGYDAVRFHDSHYSDNYA